MGQQPGLGVERRALGLGHRVRILGQHILDRDPGAGLGQAVGPPFIDAAHDHPLRAKVDGGVVLGIALDQPGRIGAGIVAHHEVVDVFVQHHVVAAVLVVLVGDAFADGDDEGLGRRGKIEASRLLLGRRDPQQLSLVVQQVDWELAGDDLVLGPSMQAAQQAVEIFQLGGVLANRPLAAPIDDEVIALGPQPFGMRRAAEQNAGQQRRRAPTLQPHDASPMRATSRNLKLRLVADCDGFQSIFPHRAIKARPGFHHS